MDTNTEKQRPWRVLPQGQIVELVPSGQAPELGDWAWWSTRDGPAWAQLTDAHVTEWEDPVLLARAEKVRDMTIWREVGHRQVYVVAEAEVAAHAVRDGVKHDVVRRSGWVACANLAAVEALADCMDWSNDAAHIVVRQVVVDERTFQTMPVSNGRVRGGL